MGKAFNEACRDRIGPYAHHNDRNRLGCIYGGPDPYASSSYDDEIDLETHQLGGKLRSPISLPIRISVLGGDVLSFDIAALAQSQPNWLGTDGLTGCIERR